MFFRGSLLLLAGALSGFAPAAAAEHLTPIVTTFTSLELGTDPFSLSIAQESTGLLHFGGNNLLTFDGERWGKHEVPDAYSVYGLALDARDRIWVGGNGNLGWFDRGGDERWRFRSLLPELSAQFQTLGQIWSTFPEGDGAIFVADDRVVRWNGTRFQSWSMPGMRRLAAMRGNDGVVYVHHVPQGLLALRAAGPEVVIPRAVLGDGVTMWLERSDEGWLLATSEGIFRHHDGRRTAFAPDVSEFLRRCRLTSGVKLPDGRYAFGTLYGGIVVMAGDGALAASFGEPEGLPSAAVYTLFVDRNGSLWGTGASAIFRVELGSATTLFDARAHLPPHAYRSIARFKGKLFVGCENGVYEWSPSTDTFAATPALTGPVNDLRASAAGLIATGFKAAKSFDGELVNQFYSTDQDTFAIGSTRTSATAVYFAEDRRILLVEPGAPPRTIVEQLPDIPRSIAEGEAGDLWIGTIARSVLHARLDPGRAVNAVPVAGTMGLPELRGRSFVKAAADGSILVFASNGGWFKAAGRETFRPITRFPARPIGAVSDFDGDGRGWVVHVSSDDVVATVARIQITGATAEWRPHSVPALPRIGEPRSILAETGPGEATTLWVGGTRSVLRHIVAGEPSAPVPRPPLLRAYAQAAESGELDRITAPLPFATPSVVFQFAAPEFARRDSLRLQSRIDGIDQDWVTARRDSRRELTALRDGQYTIRVRAVAETGVASEPTLFRFTVLPPFWRTPPFALAVALVGVMTAYGAYLLRVRSLRRRNAQLERKVRERTEELVAANAAKTQFVANMSHDIRNPLNGIVGLTLALEDSRLDSRQREVVATLRECTTYLSSLVDDVLDFASIEAGRVELRPAPFVPAELLRSIVETLKADAAASGAQLSVAIADGLPAHLLGDAGRIQQILVNFVSNGLKYAGGPIRLSVGLPADLPGEVEFAVTDRGPGLSETESATLFTKFSRLGQRRGGEHIPGTGLGLASCRLLADLMGGSVGVDSKEGEGARFFLRLPLSIAAAPVKPDTQHLPNTTVLVVEDADYNAWAAAAVLERLGLTSERACNGAEALERFARRRYNVVLLDRNLPDMDGLEVARRMRELESDGRQSVLLAITAYCTAADRARCLEAGMDGFVGKPLTPDKLRKALLGADDRLQAAVSVQAPAEAPPPALDLQLLNYLSDGTADGLAQQVERFLASLHAGQRELEQAAQAGDFERLSRGAHQLYGQAKMINAADLVQAAFDLEATAGVADEAGCQRNLRRVSDETRRVTAAMRRRPRAAHSG